LKGARARGAARKLLRRRLRTAVLAAVLALIILGAGGYFYFRSLTGRIGYGEGYDFPGGDLVTEEDVQGMEVGMEGVDASTLDGYLRQWAENGIQKLDDSGILNILLCGVDSDNGGAQGGRSDAMMLVSVNRRKRTVTLTSFFRDSYSFINLTRDPQRPRVLFDRVNSAYSLGGPATLMETLENNYKIRIDDYISVDFESFPRLINALGGVRVDVTAAEAAYINRTAPSMHGKFPSGRQVKLNGRQALVYTRIRKLDSDVNRAARQRKVITAILESAKEATPGQILNTITGCLDHVRTNLARERIDNLVRDALTQGWLKYELRQLHSPTAPDYDSSPTGFSTYITGRWLWIVDYPRDAQRLQREIYGVTNIQLDAHREDYLAGLFRQLGTPAAKPTTTRPPTAPQSTAPPAGESSAATLPQPSETSAITQTEETTAAQETQTTTEPTEPVTETQPETAQSTQAWTQPAPEGEP